MVTLKLEEEEIEKIINALVCKQYELAKVCAVRETNENWKWENFKDSVLNGFEKQEDFEKWKEEMQKGTKEEITYFENLQAKIEKVLFEE
jgi:hypothetical protein